MNPGETSNDTQPNEFYEKWMSLKNELFQSGKETASEAPATTEESPVTDGESAEKVTGSLYEREYREKLNHGKCDLFSKRRCVIAEQFPALKPETPEERERRRLDPEYRAQQEQAYAEVPDDVRLEYRLLGLAIGRLESGIDANLNPEHPLAGSEPNLIPVEIHTHEGPLVVTQWKAKEATKDLAEMQKLHEKNSQIIDFSRESEVDIDTVPEHLEKEVTSLAEDIKTLDTARSSDFKSVDGNRPKTAEILYRILDISGSDNISLDLRRKINQIRNEFMWRYSEARDAAEIRNIDERIEQLKTEKAEIEERRQKDQSSTAVARMFRRLIRPYEARDDEDRLNEISYQTNYWNEQAGILRQRAEQKHQ